MAIPDDIHFLVHDAISDGYSRSALRSAKLESPFYGVRARVGALSTVHDVCSAYAPKMRTGTLFSGLTAARLWEMPLPAYLGFDPRTVEVASRSPRRAPRGVGVRGSRYNPVIVGAAQLSGMPLLSAVDTWCSLAGQLDTVDLTAVADHLQRRSRRPALAVATSRELEDAVSRRRGSRGALELRRALADSRPLRWSRPETLLRVALISAGIPEPVLNSRVRVEGREFFLDIAWPSYRFGTEYDGDHHRTVGQFTDDIYRQELIQDTSWGLLRVTRADLFDRTAELVARVRRRLQDRGCPLGAYQGSQLVVPRR
jgi:hypothetical protein